MLCKTLCNCKRKRSCHARNIRTRSTTSNCTIFFYVLSLDTVKYTQTQNLSILGIGPYLNRTNIKSTQEDRLLRQNDKKCCDGIGFQMRLEILSQLFMELCNEYKKVHSLKFTIRKQLDLKAFGVELVVSLEFFSAFL